MWAALDAKQRFVCLCAPTGFGKSLAYMAMAQVAGLRTLYLTSTKGLQSQLMGDFAESGLVDIRGMNNYACLLERDSVQMTRNAQPVTCDDGPCVSGYRCELRKGGCLYFDAQARAQEAQLVVTNYAYWLNDGRRDEGLGRFDLLVMDEAHDAPKQLAEFLHIELQRAEVEGLLGADWLPDTTTVADWCAWAQAQADKLIYDLSGYTPAGSDTPPPMSPTDRRHMRELRRLLRKMVALASMRGKWITEMVGAARVFDPVSPSEYGELLFQGVRKVVLVGATVRPKTAELLGADPVHTTLHEYRSAFDIRRRPVLHVPTVRVNARTDQSQYRSLIARIDQLIKPRLGRKGIIHTVSYARAEMIMGLSDNRRYMIGHSTRTARSTVEAFKHMPAPAILVSPSMTTGWDFPGDECRWQIIVKVPFPDTRSEVMQARVKADPDYSGYLAMQELVQASGRGNRSVDDWCETLIVDDSLGWFLQKYASRFAPQWWLEALRRCKKGILPDPLNIT